MRKKKVLERLDIALDYYQAILNADKHFVRVEPIIEDLECIRRKLTKKPKEKTTEKIKFNF